MHDVREAQPTHTHGTLSVQDLETLLWAICRLEHRADKLVAEMAEEVGRPRGLETIGQGGHVVAVGGGQFVSTG